MRNRTRDLLACSIVSQLSYCVVPLLFWGEGVFYGGVSRMIDEC
jgi:hypothetical protein